MFTDPSRACELCGGPIIIANITGVCRTTRTCIQEDARRKAAIAARLCKVCGSDLAANNKIGICRASKACRKAGRKIHDRQYHYTRDQPKKKKKNVAVNAELLPEWDDGYIDPVAVFVAVNGIRKIAMTHSERVAAVRTMLVQGAGVRELCDHLHVHPSTVHSILDELGYECVRNEHVVASKIMVILRKDRDKPEKMLTQVSEEPL